MRGVLMAVVLALAPAAASAAAVQPLPAPPEALALARQLVEATGATKDFGERLHAVMDPIARAMTQNLPTNQQAQQAALIGVVQQQIEADAPLFMDAAAEAYARTFSTDELKGLLAFYRTPLGRTLIAKQTALVTEIGQANAKLAPKVARDILVKMCAQTTPCPPAVQQRIDSLAGA